MNELLQSWLEYAATFPGVLGCAVRMPDQSFAARSCDERFPLLQLDKLAREIAETLQVLNTNRMPAERLRWTFENARVLSVSRDDGVIATLVVARSADASREVEKLLSEVPRA
jgi:hypothetical protein